VARKRLVIRGLVVGVGFRANAHAEAQKLGLKGWIKNRRDARVEALVEGADDVVATFIEWCKKGPPSARVAAVDVTDDASADALDGFTIKPTG
jgi:acylphosphatase